MMGGGEPLRYGHVYHNTGGYYVPGVLCYLCDADILCDFRMSLTMVCCYVPKLLRSLYLSLLKKTGYRHRLNVIYPRFTRFAMNFHSTQ